MAEMTASEAVELLTAKATIPQDINDSPFFSAYIRIKVDKASAIATLVEQQAQTIERLKCCGNCRYWHLLAQDGEVIKYCEWDHKENFAFRTDICKRWKPM